MKFIPITVFETINSLIQAVEAQGCLLTIRLEAFTCRHTREEKLLAAAIAEHKSHITEGVGSISPILQPSTNGYQHGVFPPIVSLPAAMGNPSGSGDVVPSSPDSEVDDRLVYLIAALNAIHGDGYDFSVLTEQDFELVQGSYVKVEMDNMLSSLPERCYPAVGYNHEIFWQAIADQLLPASLNAPSASSQAPQIAGTQPVSAIFDQCDFFMFTSPSCDPVAQRTIWSNHVFVYSKKARVIVSIMCYGEGNMYRGDDGVGNQLFSGQSIGADGIIGGPAPLPRNGSDVGEYYYDGENMHYLQSDENSQSQTTDVEFEAATGHKNRDFYGY